jgi:antitoxin (DNA-binding transcriptional repressor) of toxin-antitoxin stability system
MATITLNELHERTSEWLYGVQKYQEIIVTDKGVPLVRIQPVSTDSLNPAANPFLNRKLLPEYEAIMNTPVGGTPIDQIIAEDRDRP